MNIETLDQETRSNLFEYLLRLGDDRLVHGHRLSEWCGHGPILEEDIALSNIALDCVGQAEMLLKTAGEVEGQGRSEDDLAYFRDEYEFRNLALLEQPRGDFAQTIARQFLYDVYTFHLYAWLKEHSTFQPLADIAAKALKEVTYHLRHSSSWVRRLGDGTQESHQRMQNAFNAYWTFTGELFHRDAVDEGLIQACVAPDLEQVVRPKWDEMVSHTLTEATLQRPEDGHMASGARTGMHTEHLGHMLSEMQILARSHQGAEW